jgi:outer membrane protein assembly factor BamA/autotransporter translocation and assembly factor TamB
MALSWRSRRLRLALACLLALGALVLALAHAPFVRARALALVADRLEAAGVRLTADRLDYNLFTLRVVLEAPALTAVGAETPFFIADAARVDLHLLFPWGAPALESIEIERPRLVILRDASGATNLPAGSSDGRGGAPVDWAGIDRLTVRGLDVRYEDAIQNLAATISDVTINLARRLPGDLTGAVAAAGGATLRLGDQQTRIDTLEGRLAFDGSTLTIERLDLTAPEARARVEGEIDLLAASVPIDLRYHATVDLAQLAPWIGLEGDESPRGGVAVAGKIEGPLAAPMLTATAAAGGIAWPPLGVISLDARASVTTRQATVESFEVGLAGGSVSGSGRVHFDEGSSTVQARWQGIDAGALLARAGAPVRIASRASGELTYQWSGDRLLGGAGRASATLSPGDPSRALAIGGRASLSIDGGRWTLNLAQRIDGVGDIAANVRGRVANDPGASTLTGRASVAAGDLGEALRQLSRAGLDIADPQTMSSIRGSANLQADLAGTLTAPRAVATLQTGDLWVGRVGPTRASARLQASLERIDIEALRAALGSNVVTGQGVLRPESGAIEAVLRADLPDLSALAGALPAEWRPAGTARVEATVGGTVNTPTVDAHITAADLHVAGQAADALRAEVHLADQLLTVDMFELQQDTGRVAFSGTYDFASERYQVDLTAERLAIDPALGARAAGERSEWTLGEVRLDARIQGEGTLTRPELRGTLSASPLSLGEYALGQASATLEASGGSIRVRAEVPEANVVVDGALALAERTFAATVTAADADLARLDVTGVVSLQAQIRGSLDALDQTTVDLDVSQARATILGGDVQLERPARAHYSPRRLDVDDLQLRIGSSVLSARGTLGAEAPAGSALTVTVLGSLADLQPLARLVSGRHEITASGTVDLRAQAAGPLDAPQVTANLVVAEGTFSAADLPSASGVALEARYADGVLDLSAAEAQWQGATLSASARVPLAVLGERLPPAFLASLPPVAAPARVDLRITSATPLVLEPFVDPETLAKLGGRIDVVASLEASGLQPADIRGDVRLERAEVELAGVTLSQAEPTRLRLAGGRLDVVSWTWTGAGNRLDVSGSADLAGDTPTLALGVNGSIDLRLISAFAPDLAASGRAVLDVRATGPAADPVVAGRLTFQDADFVVRDPRLAITGLSGGAILSDGVIRLEGIRASANGGALEAEGTIEYDGLALTGGALTIRGRGLALAIPEDLRTEVDADLTLVSSGGTPTLTGRVTIVRGMYREPISLTRQILAGQTEALTLSGQDEPGPLDDVALDIALVSAQDLTVDNNYAQFGVGANLRVVGTIGEPALIGRLTVAEGGEVFLGGRTYEVTRGAIDFTNPTRIEPILDLALETRVQRYDITLAITGTPETLDVALRSPGQSQEDVVSLLLTGQLADETSLAQAHVARGQLLMLLSGEFLDFAGRAVGLDSLQVSRGLGAAASDFDLLASDVDPQARLTITKDLTRDVELVVSQSLRKNDDTIWLVNYQPIRHVQIRGTTEGDGSHSAEFRHELAFAGPPPGAAGDASAPAPREQGRVSAVVFSGTPGVPEAELRRLLDLDPGERFDFYVWQRDQDRLHGWYHARGFLEAAVSARRVEAGASGGDPAVRLEYALTRGPRTTLTIAGAALPKDVLERMRAAWSQAVFDGFLLEDLETIAREALVASSHLQAAVSARVTEGSGSEAKEIVVDVTPGPPFSDRRIVFDGNAAVSSSELLGVLDAQDQDLENAAWIDPEVLSAPLERFYRSRGLLAATVTPEPPVFTGTTATLPVAVDEGRQFQMSAIVMQGVGGRPEADVRTDLGLTEGAAYSPLEVEAGRRRVESGYLQAGYNGVRVTADAGVDRGQARVEVVLTVNEGARQVVSEVEVAGARTTSRGTVEEALDIEPGTPADMARMYRGQKRLYDTGVFSSADVSIVPIDPAPPAADAGMQPVKAIVSLLELPLYRFRYGFRLNNELAPVEATRETRPALVADLLRRNLFGRAVTVGVAGQIEEDRRLARAIVSLPTLFRLPIVTNVFATVSRQLFPPATEFDLTLVDRVNKYTFEQRFRPAARMAIAYGYTFERKHTFEPAPDPDPFFPPVDVTVQVARLTSSYAWDTRDDPSDARRGWLHSSGLDFGSGALGSDLRFLRYLAQQYYFRTVGGGVVLASAFRLGVGRGFGGQRLDEKFLAGGGTSVRGFAEDALGPSDRFGPIGGDALLVLNQEARFPIYRWVRGVGFFDAGNVFVRPSDLSLRDLDAGTGAGLRVALPFALLRLDLGVPLTRREERSRVRWYFGIGHAF